MEILYYATFPGVRFAGGITAISNSIKENIHQFKKDNINISFFNINRIERSDRTQGKICLENYLNFYLIKRDIIKEMEANQFDIVHINTSVKLAFLKDIFVIQKLKKRFPVKVILHIHYADIEQILFKNNILNKYVIKRINKYVDKIIVLSKKLKEELLNIGVTEEKINILYNFYDLKYTYQKVNKKNCKKKLLFLGSIDRRKGIIDLIYAVENLDKADYILNIAGTFNNGKLERYIKRLILQKGLSNNINFLAYIKGKEKSRVLSDTDIMILPSYGEGMPLVLLEGMAYGCAIISTNVGGIPELITDEYNGFLYNPGDINSLYTLIKKLLENDKLMNKIKKNNFLSADKYTLDKFINNLSYIYKEM